VSPKNWAWSVRHVDLAIGMGATFLDQPVEETQRFCRANG
jgi:hypothetical protein